MGKYMRKAKVTGEVAVMEVAQSTIGVRTRAKTLALQRLQKISSSPTTTTSTTGTAAVAAAASTDTDNKNSGSSYFQLRSRKLERPPLNVDSSSKKLTQAKEVVVCKKNPNPKLRTSPRFVVGTVNSGSVGSVNISCSKNNDEGERIQEKNNFDDLGLECSFGENVLDIEERDRSTRETTPCSLMRDPDTIKTPGSSTRPPTLSNRRMRNPMRENIPTTREMDEFFATAEQQQQRFFTEKYNFDPVNDVPLPGRYEWVSVDL